MAKVEIIYITFNRFHYTKETLPRVLDNAGFDDYTVSIYDNGSKDETVPYLRSLKHPRIKAINYSKYNKGISTVTNHFWSQATSEFLGKVDNDIYLPDNWLRPIMDRFAARDPKMGVMGLSHFHMDDLNSIPEPDFSHNIKTLVNGHKIVIQTHMGGACYIYPRELYKRYGNVQVTKNPKGGWTEKQWHFFREGYYIGYVYPWLTCQHLDDVRYAKCQHPNKERTEEDKTKIIASERKATEKLIVMPRPAEYFKNHFK